MYGECLLTKDKNKHARCIGLHITTGNDLWTVEHSTILPNVTIGEGAAIAAGGVVVKKDVEPYTMVGSVPAKVIKKKEV